MIKLENFSIYKQLTPHTCGYAALSMVSTFLGKPIKENQIPKGPFYKIVGGTPPWEFVKIFKRCLPDCLIKLENPPSKIIAEIILKQIQAGMPVPIICSTLNDFDKPNLNMHYEIVIGIDKEKTRVILANPFGYEETLKIENLLDKMDYSNYTKMPFRVRLILWLGVLRRNNLFIIKKQGDNNASPNPQGYPKRHK